MVVLHRVNTCIREKEKERKGRKERRKGIGQEKTEAS